MSPASFAFHPDAIEEALSAARWYRERSPITAKRFVAELDQVIDTIIEAPFRGVPHPCAFQGAGFDFPSFPIGLR